jgi:predicted SAM-dependent methyltransferase
VSGAERTFEIPNDAPIICGVRIERVPNMITRVQLGTSRLENLRPEVRQKFLDKSWMHLGDPEDEGLILRKYSISYLFKILKKQKMSYIVDRIAQKIQRSNSKTNDLSLKTRELYDSTNFREFYYHKGDQLPFDDGSIDFIYSEHFFEHLFLDESYTLFKECHRILKPFGVIRTCVPDADLRTYEAPESLGFPEKKMPYTDPGKHKTRWSVYSLTEVLKFAGFVSRPLRYCDKSGRYVKEDPSSIAGTYAQCPDRELIFDLSYINRIDSLIVDGIKKPT